MYGLADTPAELPRAAVVATDPDPELAARLEQAPTLRRAPEEIVCGRGTRLAAGRRGTWLRLGAAPPEARLFVGDRAPVPVRRAVFVASGRVAGRQRGGHLHRRAGAHARGGRGRPRTVVSHRSSPYPEAP